MSSERHVLGRESPDAPSSEDASLKKRHAHASKRPNIDERCCAQGCTSPDGVLRCSLRAREVSIFVSSSEALPENSDCSKAQTMVVCPFWPKDIALSQKITRSTGRAGERGYYLALCGAAGVLIYTILVSCEKDGLAQSLDKLCMTSSQSSQKKKSCDPAKGQLMSVRLVYSLSPLGAISVVAFSSPLGGISSDLFATGSAGGVLSIWRLPNFDSDVAQQSSDISPVQLKPIWSSACQCSRFTSICFSPSNTRLAAVCWNGDLYLLERASALFTAWNEQGIMIGGTESVSILDEMHDEWMHSRLVELRTTPAPTGMDVSEWSEFLDDDNRNVGTQPPHGEAPDRNERRGNDAVSFSGPSLVAWLCHNERGCMKDILLGLHGPSQHWSMVDPLSMKFYLKHAVALDLEHRGPSGSISDWIESSGWGGITVLESTSDRTPKGNREDPEFLDAVVRLETSANTIHTQTRRGEARHFEISFN